MNDPSELNQFRINELMDRAMTHHYRHALALKLDGWDCTRRTRYEVYLDKRLLYVDNVTMIDFFPRGSFECHRCHKDTPMSHTQFAYFNYHQDAMICTSCNDRVKHDMVPAFPRMCARVYGETVDLDSYEHVNLIDRTPNEKRTQIQRTIALKRAERIVAENPGFIFLDGRCTRDLYHDMLARRVIRRFRQNALNRLREKVAYVIASVTKMNKETALDIAQAYILQSSQ